MRLPKELLAPPARRRREFAHAEPGRRSSMIDRAERAIRGELDPGLLSEAEKQFVAGIEQAISEGRWPDPRADSRRRS